MIKLNGVYVLACWLGLVMATPVQADAGRKYQFTVFSQIMQFKVMDPDGDGRGMADIMATNNTLHRSIGGPQVATADTSMIITKAASQESGLETRLFHMIITFTNPTDTIVIDGISTAAVPDNWMLTNQPSHRAVVGGTGRFNGARGQAIYTRVDPVWVKIDMKFSVMEGGKGLIFPK